MNAVAAASVVRIKTLSGNTQKADTVSYFAWLNRSEKKRGLYHNTPLHLCEIYLISFQVQPIKCVDSRIESFDGSLHRLFQYSMRDLHFQ